MAISDLLDKIFPNPDDDVSPRFPGRAAKPLSPDALIKAVTRAATSRSMRWGSRAEIPNRYVVLISQEDWDDYYRTRQGFAEDQVRSAVSDIVDSSDGAIVLGSRLDVSIRVDQVLRLGEVRVETQFTDAGPGEAREPMDSANRPVARQPEDMPRTTRRGVPAGLATQGEKTMPRPAPSSVGGGAAALDATPAAVPRGLTTAILTTPTGVRFTNVADGTTFGLVRRPSSPRPDLELPATDPGITFCSQLQGRLSRGGEGWSVTNLGGNELAVVRGGSSVVSLKRGEAASLADGDELVVGTAREPVLVFRTS